MKLWSISFAYKLGLGFHAMNNEGSDGSNLMQPRQIDVGSITYDGISGAIIRHHILEKFVLICEREGLPVLPLSAGLHPDRGPLGIRAAAKGLKYDPLKKDKLFASVRAAIAQCAVVDVGGFLAAWKGEGESSKYVAEKEYIDSCCARLPSDNNHPESVKRESCFDIAWLISNEPSERVVTEHSAFRATTGMNNRYAQTMRSNIFSGVARAELHRVGMDDNWYLQSSQDGTQRADRLAISAEEQTKRQCALIRAMAEFIAAPSGAKMAAWAPHVFLTEGAILLSSARTAPFVSPIRVDLSAADQCPIKDNADYQKKMTDAANNSDTWAWEFNDVNSLLNAVEMAEIEIRRK